VADLERIFADLSAKNALCLTAGCAGFADILASSPLFRQESKPAKPQPGGILAVCGSVNEASARQTGQAKKDGYAVVTLPARVLLDANAELFASLAEDIGKTLEAEGFALLRTDGDRTLGADAPEKISRAVGHLVKLLTSSHKVGSLILFGGHTANAVMREVGIKGFRPRTEIAPGVVYSEADSRGIITKAGGFGGDRVVKEILCYLHSL
jgi:uncharacterized protein YgbK (DUF1537 family)